MAQSCATWYAALLFQYLALAPNQPAWTAASCAGIPVGRLDPGDDSPCLHAYERLKLECIVQSADNRLQIAHTFTELDALEFSLSCQYVCMRTY